MSETQKLYGAVVLAFIAGAAIAGADYIGFQFSSFDIPELAIPVLQASESVSGYARVRDGDTIVVSGVPVRLNGLHCPERGDPGGAAATAAMRQLVGGERVTCDLTGERTYDREVGRCRVDGEDLGATLIRQGVCARCPHYDPLGRYIPAQLAAGRWDRSMPRYCH